MNAVVLGAGGLLGRHVVGALGHRSASARGLSRAECDLRDVASLTRAIRGADVVINCAAFTQVDRAEAEPDDAFATNAVGAENAARAAREAGARFVHVSTDFVFDGESARPYEVDDEPRPLSVYGRSKREGEVRVLALGATVVRVQAMYGAGGTGFSTQMFEMLRAGKPLRLDAERRVQPSYVSSTAEMLVRIAELDRAGIFHVSCAGETTWADFGAQICMRLQIEPTFRAVPSAELPAPAERPRYCVFSHRALRDAGLGEMPSWQDALGKYLSR